MDRSSNPHCPHLITRARQLIEHLPDSGLQAAFLFGSVAWGDADAASDLDIMLLLNRPADYREVTRIRLADLFDNSLPQDPLFADLDRIATETFVERIHTGAMAMRVVNSVILADTDNFYAHLRDQVTEEFLQPSAREKRFLAHEKQVTEHQQAALLTLETDTPLAALHTRLALQDAGAALIELSGNRVSPSHFAESLEQALHNIDDRLFTQTLAALSLDASPEAIDRSLRAYDAFADALKSWQNDPDLTRQLSPEDLAWGRHIYEKQEEIAYKVATFTQTRHLPKLLYYFDGLFQVPICIQTSKIFQLRSSGKAERMTIPDFHIALRQEPTLYDEWMAALRLSAARDQVLKGIDLTSKLLAAGNTLMKNNTQC